MLPLMLFLFYTEEREQKFTSTGRKRTWNSWSLHIPMDTYTASWSSVHQTKAIPGQLNLFQAPLLSPKWPNLERTLQGPYLPVSAPKWGRLGMETRTWIPAGWDPCAQKIVLGYVSWCRVKLRIRVARALELVQNLRSDLDLPPSIKLI